MKALIRKLPDREYQFVIYFKFKVYDVLLSVFSAGVVVGGYWLIGWLLFGHGTDLSE